MQKNLMPELAKLLGVEIGEEFTVYDTEVGVHGRTVFLITDKGLVCKEEPKRDNIYVLNRLLRGNMEIKKLPWKPKEDDDYYVLDVEIEGIRHYLWSDATFDYAMLSLGMVYRTREEAEAHMAEDYERLTGKKLEE